MSAGIGIARHPNVFLCRKAMVCGQHVMNKPINIFLSKHRLSRVVREDTLDLRQKLLLVVRGFVHSSHLGHLRRRQPRRKLPKFVRAFNFQARILAVIAHEIERNDVEQWLVILILQFHQLIHRIEYVVHRRNPNQRSFVSTDQREHNVVQGLVHESHFFAHDDPRRLLIFTTCTTKGVFALVGTESPTVINKQGSLKKNEHITSNSLPRGFALILDSASPRNGGFFLFCTPLLLQYNTYIHTTHCFFYCKTSLGSPKQLFNLVR